MTGFTIGRFAKAAGVGVETVRFYQRRGLLPVPRPGRSKFRDYDQTLLTRLRFIRRAQSAGFTLKEIKELLKLDRTQDRARIRAVAQSRLNTLEAQMADFQTLIASLKGLVHHCATAPKTKPCPIVESFGSSPMRTEEKTNMSNDSVP
jgi:MerR family mercuric resistance operon transcriptional regulator